MKCFYRVENKQWVEGEVITQTDFVHFVSSDETVTISWPKTIYRPSYVVIHGLDNDLVIRDVEVVFDKGHIFEESLDEKQAERSGPGL